MHYKKVVIFLCFFLTLCSWKTKDISLFPNSPKCGDTLKITIAKAPSRKKFIAEFNQKKYPFYPIGKKKQRCLIGLSCKLIPGEYELYIFKLKKGKKKKMWTEEIKINPGMFSKTNLKISSKKTKLIFDSRNKSEREQIRRILKKKTPLQMWQGKFKMPVEGKITDGYGTYRTINKGINWGQHKGVDISAPFHTPVLAANRGRVILVADFILYGKIVFIDHGQGVETTYIHLSSVCVQKGDPVEKGNLIGKIGSTGLSTGAHLHWGLYIHGVAVDPLNWVKYEY